MPRAASKSDFFLPLAGLAVVATAIVIGGVLALTHAFDVSARRHEEAMVAAGLKSQRAELAGRVVPQAVWDDAVLNLALKPSAAWAADNVGSYLHNALGFDGAFVVGADDRPLFAYEEGKPAPIERFGALASITPTMISKIRQREARRGRVRTSDFAATIQDTDLVVVGGQPEVVVATLVAPDFGANGLSPTRSAIVFTTRKLDEGLVRYVGRRYLLIGAHVHHGDLRGEPDQAHVLLADNAGRPIATLDWTPGRPGQMLLGRIIAPLLAVMIFLAGAAVWLARRTHRMAQGLVASEARAAHLAYYDPLTGLPNRVLLTDRLGLALQQARRTGRGVAVHIIDLDRFKEVNDTYGHHVGDELIAEAARRMAAECRGADTFARLSGDEFAIVQTDASAAAAAALAGRLVRRMAEPVDLGAGRLFVGCSIGISVVGRAEVEPSEALRQADLALYRAKDGGRGQYALFEVEMDAAIKMRRAIELDLREALAKGELTMAYQPQVDRHGVMTGVEALVRWNHPVRGPVSPALFVPIAEECGLIVDLGFFTLRQVFLDSRRWRRLKVGINISAAQLRMKDFLRRLSDLVVETMADPRQYELEITEGLLLGDDPMIHETLRSLRQMGFGLALDDFGTGFSSLSYLQRFPISKIKIDRSFVANLGVDEEAEAVVSAIVKLARALKLGVIAEGVETLDQRQRLAQAGCSEIQGFLFSQPVPADQIEGQEEIRLSAQAA